MKDNQMKQAEELESAAFKYYTDWKKDKRDDVIFPVDAFKAGFEARAKLTTSQVSEPVGYVSQFGLDRVNEDEIHDGICMKKVADSFYNIALYKQPTTTPQEAISPAIAEYIKRLETIITEIHDSGDCGKGLSPLMNLIASKPTDWSEQ